MNNNDVYDFDADQELGGAVTNKKAFCMLVKNMPEVTYEDVMGVFRDPLKPGLVGNKWSKLFGFSFRVKNVKRSGASPIFQIVYCPKQSNNLTRNGNALHGWYIWEHFNADLKHVTDIEKVYNDYGFNANIFFHSDYFENNIKVFVDNCSYVMEHQMKALIEQHKDDKRFMHTVNNLRKSIQLDRVLDVQNVRMYDLGNGVKVQHAKIGYNADKTYALRNLDPNKSPDVKVAKTPEPEKPLPDTAAKYARDHVKFDPSMKHKFGGGRDLKKVDAKIFDRADKLADELGVNEDTEKIFDDMMKEAVNENDIASNLKITHDMMSSNGQTISPKGLTLLVNELKKHNIGAEYNNVLVTDKNQTNFHNVVGAYAMPYDGGLAIIVDDKKLDIMNQ